MDKHKNATPLWEKLVGALGLILLCCGFIYLTWAEITAKRSPLHIVFNVEKIVAVDEHFVVIVDVENTSRQSAAALQVQGTLAKGGRDIETNNVQVDYIPANSSRTIGFFFKEDPNTGDLQFRALGYQEP